MSNQTLRRLQVARDEQGEITSRVVEQPPAPLAEGEVRIRVRWSSLNYKDALATSGHPGLGDRYPRVPGIDAAGEVIESRSTKFSVGEQVIATSYDLGVGRNGGWSEELVAPAEWIVPLPNGLTLREAMLLGTAGLTAAMCVDALMRHDVIPEQGDILVTGATGGVGSLAVRLLAQLGYRVVAVSGKTVLAEQLRTWGAAEVVNREAFADRSSKPLLRPRWAGVIDNVGGEMLAQAIRQTIPNGCVTACGLVAGTDLSLTVYPFILRGVTLVGIDSAYCSLERRTAIWQKLAGPWKLAHLETQVAVATLDTLPLYIAQMLRGEIAGRVLVQLV